MSVLSEMFIVNTCFMYCAGTCCSLIDLMSITKNLQCTIIEVLLQFLRLILALKVRIKVLIIRPCLCYVSLNFQLEKDFEFKLSNTREI